MLTKKSIESSPQEIWIRIRFLEINGSPSLDIRDAKKWFYRSREQRYTRLADWDYIAECKKTVDIPVFGNGDILNYEVKSCHMISLYI